MAQKQYDFIAGAKGGIYMADGGKRSDTFMRRRESGRKRAFFLATILRAWKFDI